LAQSIISLLWEDMYNINESAALRQSISVQCGEPKLCESTSRKWIPVVYNHNRKPKDCVRHSTKHDTSCIPTSNKYMVLNKFNSTSTP
jgi:hypothetical protein